ncbi:MAG TPA: methyltransferase [Acidimicrobiales bacterium]|nr:methyltransferase [Acidimicrobiales bacterium]
MPNPGDAGQHYFSARPASGSAVRELKLHLPDLTLDLVVDRGVFSGDRVDPGTKLLLSEAPMPADLAGDVLDLGCGYGPIAVTVARRAASATVWALDVNERALALCETNARTAGVGDRVRPVAEAHLPADVRFTAVYANPPIRIGKGPLQTLLTRWLGRMRPDATAWLVVHKHLGSDSLAGWLASQGYGVHRRTSRMGYRILEVRPPA